MTEIARSETPLGNIQLHKINARTFKVFVIEEAIIVRSFVTEDFDEAVDYFRGLRLMTKML